MAKTAAELNLERAKKSLGTNPFTKEYVSEAYKFYSEPFTKQFEEQRQALDREAVAKGMYRGGGYTKALGESFEDYQKKVAQDVMIPLTETAMKMGEQARQFDLELGLGERRQTLTEREAAAGATGVWGGGQNINLGSLGFTGVFDDEGKAIQGGAFNQFSTQFTENPEFLANKFLEKVGREATEDELTTLAMGRTVTPGMTKTLAGERMETELEIAKAELEIAQDRLGISREELGLERTRLEKDSFTRMMEITGTSGSGSVSAGDLGINTDGVWRGYDDLFAAADKGISDEEVDRKWAEMASTEKGLQEAFKVIGHTLTRDELNSLMDGGSIDVTAAPTMEGRKFMIDSAMAFRESLVQEGFSEREISIVESQNEREKDKAKLDRAIARARETGRLTVEVDGVSVDVETLEQRRFYMDEEMQDGQLRLARAKEANRQKEEFARLTGQFEEFSEPVGIDDFLGSEAMATIFPDGIDAGISPVEFMQHEDLFSDEFYGTYGRIPTDIEIDVLLRGQKLDPPDPIETLARMAFDLDATGVAYVDHPEKGLIQVDSIAKRESDARITQISNDHQLSISQLDQAKLEFETIQRGEMKVTVYDPEVGGPVTKYLNTLSKTQQEEAIANARENIEIAQDQLDVDRGRLEQAQLEFKVEAIGQYETERTITEYDDEIGGPVTRTETVLIDTIAKKNADQARTLANNQFEQAKAEFAAIQTGELDGDITLAQEQMDLAEAELTQAKLEFSTAVTGKYNVTGMDGVIIGVDTLSSQELAMRKGVALGYFGEGESAVNTLEANNELWNQQITERMTFLEEQRQRFTERAATADQLGYWSVGGPNGLLTAEDLGVNVKYAAQLPSYEKMMESAEWDMLAEAYENLTGKKMTSAQGAAFIQGRSVDTGQEIRIETMTARADRLANMWKQADLFGGLGDAKTAAADMFTKQLTLDTNMSEAEVARINKAVEQADRQLDQAAMEFATTTTLNLGELMGRLGEGGSITADQLGVDVGPAQEWLASNVNHPARDAVVMEQFGGPIKQAYEAAFGHSLTDTEVRSLLNGDPVETANSPTLQARQLAGTISQQSLERAADLKKFADAHELETTQVTNQTAKWDEDRELESTRLANQYDLDQRSFNLAKQELDATLTGYVNFEGRVNAEQLGLPTSEWLKSRWDSLGDMLADPEGDKIYNRFLDSVESARPGLNRNSKSWMSYAGGILWNGEEFSVDKTPTLQAEEIANRHGLDLQRFTEASDQFDRNFENQQKLSWMQLTGTTEEDFYADSATSLQYKSYKQSMDEYQKNESKRDTVWNGFLNDAVDWGKPSNSIGTYSIPISMKNALQSEMGIVFALESLDPYFQGRQLPFPKHSLSDMGKNVSAIVGWAEEGATYREAAIDLLEGEWGRNNLAPDEKQKIRQGVVPDQGGQTAAQTTAFQLWMGEKLLEAKNYFYDKYGGMIGDSIQSQFGVQQPQGRINDMIQKISINMPDPPVAFIRSEGGDGILEGTIRGKRLVSVDAEGRNYVTVDGRNIVEGSPQWHDYDIELLDNQDNIHGGYSYFVYGMGTDNKSEEEMGRLYQVLEGHQMAVATAAAGPSGWAVAGAVAGSVLSAGAEVGAAAAVAASDRMVKDNVLYVGNSPSGLKVYEFDYKFGLGPSGRYRGVMADEIPRSAVVPQLGWYDKVDYSRIDVELERIG